MTGQGSLTRRIRFASSSLSQFILLAFIAFICLSSDSSYFFLNTHLIPGADAALAIRVNATTDPVNFRSWDPFRGETDHYTLSGLLMMGNVMPDCTIQVNPAAGPGGQVILSAVDPTNAIVDSIIVLRYDWLDNCATFDDVSSLPYLFLLVVAIVPIHTSASPFLGVPVCRYTSIYGVYIIVTLKYFHRLASPPHQLSSICLFVESPSPSPPLFCSLFSSIPRSNYLSMHPASSPCQHAAVCWSLFLCIPNLIRFNVHYVIPLHTFFFPLCWGLDKLRRNKGKKEGGRLILK